MSQALQICPRGFSGAARLAGVENHSQGPWGTQQCWGRSWLSEFLVPLELRYGVLLSSQQITEEMHGCPFVIGLQIFSDYHHPHSSSVWDWESWQKQKTKQNYWEDVPITRTWMKWNLKRKTRKELSDCYLLLESHLLDFEVHEWAEGKELVFALKPEGITAGQLLAWHWHCDTCSVF